MRVRYIFGATHDSCITFSHPQLLKITNSHPFFSTCVRNCTKLPIIYHTATLWNGYYYYFHFTDEETKAKRRQSSDPGAQAVTALCRPHPHSHTLVSLSEDLLGAWWQTKLAWQEIREKKLLTLGMEEGGRGRSAIKCQSEAPPFSFLSLSSLLERALSPWPRLHPWNSSWLGIAQSSPLQ